MIDMKIVEPECKHYVTSVRLPDEETDYVKNLREQIERRILDQENAHKGKVDLNNALVQDVYYRITNVGSATGPRMAREFNTSNESVHHSAKFLVKHGFIGEGRTQRGYPLYE